MLCQGCNESFALAGRPSLAPPARPRPDGARLQLGEQRDEQPAQGWSWRERRRCERRIVVQPGRKRRYGGGCHQRGQWDERRRNERRGTSGAGTSGAGSPSAGVGAGGGGGAAVGGGCAKADVLCLTFDDLAVGAMPQSAPFQTYNCAGQSTSMDLLVEDGQGVDGSKALTSKKSLNGGCNLLADLGEHAELWVTADVKFSAGVPVGTVHELTPFEITKTASDDPGIRPGIRADSSCNSWPGAELNITGGGERTGCTAFKFATEQWYCLEVQIKNLPAAVEGDLFIDSAKQPFHIHQDEAETVVNPDWTGARMLRLGSRSYSSSVESPIYVDNLSVSTTRVGCSP